MKKFLVQISDRSVLFTTKTIQIEAVNADEALRLVKLNHPSCNVTLVEEER